MTSKCDKNKKVAHKAIAECVENDLGYCINKIDAQKTNVNFFSMSDRHIVRSRSLTHRINSFACPLTDNEA